MAAQLAVDVFEQERRRLELAAVELRTSLAEKNTQLAERCSEAAREEAKLLQIRYASELKDTNTQVDELKQRLLVLGEDARAQSEEMKDAEEQLQAAEEYETQSLRRKQVQNEEQACLQKLEKNSQLSKLASEIRLATDSKAAAELQLFQMLRAKEESSQREAESLGTSPSPMTLQEQIAADLKDQLIESQETVAGLEESFLSMRSLCLKTEERIEEMLQGPSLEAQASQKDKDVEAHQALLEEKQKLHKTNTQIRQVQRLHAIADDLAAELRRSGAVVCDAAAASPMACGKTHEAVEGLLSEEHELQAEVSARCQATEEVEVEVKCLEEELEHSRNKVQEDQMRTAEVTERRPICEKQAEELRARLSKLHSKDPSAVACGTEDALKQIMLALDAKGRRLLLQKQMMFPTQTQAEKRAVGNLPADSGGEQ